ncbi:uncharacterized protein LOC111359048 [Spodoptera litura]|uniref:Uncharacterized protein LOC111359048 n=1 Tax=Spodoptera litura TaxID=69820 RepID=A0A9J7EG65_SPOLT|nr:uncharacterized protein LOC111359048 [Spodoptera litura]
MGCTSSAPNMVNSSKSEKSIQFEEDASEVQSRDTEEIIYRSGNDTDETKLPSCDNLSEHNINVVRNISTSSLKTEKDNQEDRHSNEMILNKTVSSATLHEEESPPKLEEVVEKVVDLHSSENLNETKPENKHDETARETGTRESNDSDNTKESNFQDNETHEDEKQDTQNVDCPEEATSPSQSESSRATRWEALADIAAELPPSLTVDPVTGQIYALSK